jgi:hypothetical protein
MANSKKKAKVVDLTDGIGTRKVVKKAAAAAKKMAAPKAKAAPKKAAAKK